MITMNDGDDIMKVAIVDIGQSTIELVIEMVIVVTLNCCFSSFLSRKLFRPFVFTTFLNEGSVCIKYVCD